MEEWTKYLLKKLVKWLKYVENKKKNRTRKIRKIEEKQMQGKNVWWNKHKYNIILKIKLDNYDI